jgi:CDP-diacylglycerol--glycerol-3-phosphate 3-phosphatidyltransferase
MKRIWEAIQRGYLWTIEPVADFLVRRRVSPNAITAIGTLCSIAGGIIYATGHIRTAGFFLSFTALFDVLDGTVARRTGTSSVFGAFWDSTLDRVADAAVLGGLMIFYATNREHYSMPMVVISLFAVVGAFVTSYTRSRAENIGIDAKVGMLQRPERSTLLSAPQALFGLAFNGWMLIIVVTLLAVTSWITVWQRIRFVYDSTREIDAPPPVVHRDDTERPPAEQRAGTLKRA